MSSLQQPSHGLFRISGLRDQQINLTFIILPDVLEEIVQPQYHAANYLNHERNQRNFHHDNDSPQPMPISEQAHYGKMGFHHRCFAGNDHSDVLDGNLSKRADLRD